MPGTTPKGFPYAQPADPLVQWPATSQALAEKVDSSALVCGVSDVTSDANGAFLLPAIPAGFRLVSCQYVGSGFVVPAIYNDNSAVAFIANGGPWANATGKFRWVAGQFT